MHISLTNKELNLVISALIDRQINGKDLLSPEEKGILYTVTEYLEEVNNEG